MNPFLTSLQEQILNSELTEQARQDLLKSLTIADKQWAITDFKLERTEKVKKTTTILLEETIEELEKKRKAVELQNRELEIETALERVRSCSMAMQKSEELKDVIKVVYDQFIQLGINSEHTGFVMDYKNNDDYHLWVADPLGVPEKVVIPYFDCIYYNQFNEAKKNGVEFFATKLSFEEKNVLYQKLFEFIPQLPEESKAFYFNCPGLAISTVLLEDIGLYMENFSGVPYSDEDNKTLIRIARVFQQAYTRFLDLKKAEALAKEALKQASLDRIRGHVASMRSASDLEHITPLLWNEFGVLNIPFIRCGVFIMNEADSVVNVFLSSRDGESLGVLQLPFNMPGLTKNTVEHWYRKEVYKEHWNKQEFIAWMQTLIQVGQLHDMSSYQGSADAPESLYLHFVPFKQGMLYVGSAEALHEEHIELIKTLASTFSIAYSRYEDFRLLEDAKNRIEITLHELKATQSQLVQAEKMASLGELTAGIAHEIQNPLNFVNNFSEVNTEMITEVRDALKSGNWEGAEELLNTLAENNEKILQHGKRADAIVRGMLQHSRASSGEKELTDINALADEYLKLAYHGYRAKEKNFNVNIDTDLDPSIGKIRIVPQDLGRVLLNLYNNAFYAVNEKIKNGAPDPRVCLTTTREGNYILIKVEDNGKGIPEKIREKIFQPFFTTKPTGQGTGLGLSLSYDIVKAHGGEIRVDSSEGIGTSFTVQLPLK